ncbi:mitochondrial outer membrane protein porin [Apiospora arundinis]
MPVVKGGVWTNAEDEILKASVSKYGLNQWARVSSLLQRKTAKQCKARWSEWLDPSIKKIEWSKEEDEKLLHLAKLMPTQWRTIAPLVGRTANQCPEGGETQAPTADDVRRLRPGEVDPNPESKPAKPDTIDLDEDEKEMLSEARARLANTQGKKAKRKERERQQEESRRVAALQKRRELKTAGINIKVVTRKPGQMDYNADIPFEKAPTRAKNSTSTSESVLCSTPQKQQLANKRKGEQDDDGERKKRKNDKEGPSASMQAALKAGQMQKIREAEQSSKRRALNLPAPQVGEGELEEIVKMGMMGERASSLAQSSENDATRGLVNTYSTITSQTPIRTPMAPAQEDHIANEIRNIKALTNNQSALLGGDNAALEEGAGSTGFESATPRTQVMSTPNPLATPLRNGANGVGATPGRPGQTPLRTPRDSFALNAGNEMALVGGSARAREMAVKRQLKQGLASLPKPKESEWELEAPEDQMEIVVAEESVEDAAVRDRREREIREAQEALERKRRTQVLQKELPRPELVDFDVLMKEATAIEDPVESMVAREAALLVANDAAKYPIPGSRTKANPANVNLAQIDDNALAEARLQILLEVKDLPKPEAVASVFERENINALMLGLGCYEDDEEEVQAHTMKTAFNNVQNTTIEIAEKCSKVEKKLGLHLGGYQNRAKILRQKMGQAAEELEKAQFALSGFSTLNVSEEIAIRSRSEALREEVAYVSRREREAQEQYREAKDMLDAIGGAFGVNGHR